MTERAGGRPVEVIDQHARVAIAPEPDCPGALGHVRHQILVVAADLNAIGNFQGLPAIACVMFDIEGKRRSAGPAFGPARQPTAAGQRGRKCQHHGMIIAAGEMQGLLAAARVSAQDGGLVIGRLKGEGAGGVPMQRTLGKRFKVLGGNKRPGKQQQENGENT